MSRLKTRKAAYALQSIGKTSRRKIGHPLGHSVAVGSAFCLIMMTGITTSTTMITITAQRHVARDDHVLVQNLLLQPFRALFQPHPSPPLMNRPPPLHLFRPLTLLLLRFHTLLSVRRHRPPFSIRVVFVLAPVFSVLAAGEDNVPQFERIRFIHVNLSFLASLCPLIAVSQSSKFYICVLW